MAPPDDKVRSELDLIAAKLEEHRHVEGGRVTFPGSVFYRILFPLLHYSGVQGTVPEVTAYVLCREAASEVGRQGTITGSALRDEIQAKLKVLLRQDVREFVLITTISVTPPEDQREHTVEGWRIRIGAAAPDEYDPSQVRGTMVEGWKPYGREWKWLTARGYARSPEEALDRSTHAVDVLRGVWNLGHGAGIGWFVRLDASHRSSSLVRVGPAFTVHDTTAPKSKPAWAYDPSHCPSREEVLGPSLGPGGWDNARHLLGRIAPRKLRKGIRKFVLDGIVRYCQALDKPDPDFAFILAWSALEHLTMPAGVHSDTLVSRVGRAYGEWAPLDRITLEMLRHHRNTSVHQGTASQFRWDMFSPLVEILSDLLILLLNAHHEFRSPERFWSFLDLPPDRKGLEESIALSHIALKIRGYMSAETAGNETKRT